MRLTDFPFERSGFISELHYGQALYSYQRRVQTIFKSDKADILCVPTGFSKTSFLKKEIINQKEISKKVKSKLLLAAEESKQTESAATSDATKQGGDLISIVCRYSAGGLPRRDIAFMQSVKRILSDGLDLFNAREGSLLSSCLYECMNVCMTV